MARVNVSGESSASGSQWTQLYLGVGFTTLATVLLGLSLTRLFSVIFFYQFAFVAISLALFGIGAGGIFSYVIANRPGNLSSELGRLTFLNSVLVVPLLWFFLSRHGEMTLGALIAVCVGSAIPFFFAGTVVSLAIGQAMDRIDRAHSFEIMGAAAGCLLLVPFLDFFGGPNTVIAAGVIYGVAASIWFARAGEGQLRAMAVLVSLLLVILMIMNGTAHFFDVQWATGQKLPPERMAKWNSFSRVGLTQVGSGESKHWDIRIDAVAATDIPDIDWDKPLTLEQKEALLYQGAGLPYLLRPAAKTVILGVGGGHDVARALAAESKDVTGVETNPIIANDIMRGQMRVESHNLYSRPEVRIAVEDGRSFIRRSSEKYQVLQITLSDTRASSAGGALALLENHLYTTDAFKEFLMHLNDDGVLAVSRWEVDPPRESLRIVSLGMEALAQLGESHAAEHVIVVREQAQSPASGDPLDTILISRKPFTAADREMVGHIAAEYGMDLLHLPGAKATNAFSEMLASDNPKAFSRNYHYDVSPVDDDRPFFFYDVRAQDLWEDVRQSNPVSVGGMADRIGPLLFGLLGLCAVAILLLMVLPPLVLGGRLPKQPGGWTFLLYFVCLGFGYVLIQMVLIRKVTPFLGPPTQALTVIVLSLLMMTAAGSYCSSRIATDGKSRLNYVLGTIAVLIGVLAIVAAPLVRQAATWPWLGRVALTVALISPVAFFMGMPFSVGLRRLVRLQPAFVRWAWSLKVAASVMGWVASLVLSIYLGLRATMLIGGVMYLLALAALAATQRNTEA